MSYINVLKRDISSLQKQVEGLRAENDKLRAAKRKAPLFQSRLQPLLSQLVKSICGLSFLLN